MNNYYVYCITKGKVIDKDLSRKKANEIRRKHRENTRPKHKVEVRVLHSRPNTEVIPVVRKRVVSLNANYKSNWYTDDDKVFEKLIQCEKKYPNGKAFILEEKRIVEQVSYEFNKLKNNKT